MSKSELTCGTECSESVKCFTKHLEAYTMCKYYYRHTNGMLFSVTKKTLAECKESKDSWVASL